MHLGRRSLPAWMLPGYNRAECRAHKLFRSRASAQASINDVTLPRGARHCPVGCYAWHCCCGVAWDPKPAIDFLHELTQRKYISNKQYQSQAMYLVRLFLNIFLYIFLKFLFSSLFYKISSLIVVICPGSTFLNLCKIMYGCIDSLFPNIFW